MGLGRLGWFDRVSLFVFARSGSLLGVDSFEFARSDYGLLWLVRSECFVRVRPFGLIRTGSPVRIGSFGFAHLGWFVWVCSLGFTRLSSGSLIQFHSFRFIRSGSFVRVRSFSLWFVWVDCIRLG